MAPTGEGHMKTTAALAAAFFVCSNVAIAQTPAPSETVVMPPYPGVFWTQVTNVKTADRVLFEWIREGQTRENIHDMLVEQAFYNLRTMSPAEFAERMLASTAVFCEKGARTGPKLATEHGFAVAYGQSYCVRRKGTNKDVDMFIKVIGGRNALYVIQREFHYPTTPESVPAVRVWPKGKEAEAKTDMDAHYAASMYLGSVFVCPTADGTKCPAVENPSGNREVHE